MAADADFSARMQQIARWACVLWTQEHLAGEQVLDAETMGVNTIQLDDVERVLANLAAGSDAKLDDRAFNYGAPPIPSDRSVHVGLSSYLQLDDPTAVVAGEEATMAEWRRVLDAGRDMDPTTVYLLDAIDGSGPFEDLTFGYGMTLTSYTKAHRLTLRGTMVANSSGLFMTWDRFEGVQVGSVLLPELLQPRAFPIQTDAVQSVAVVAARREHRGRLERLLAVDGELEPRWVVYNTGGSPAAFGMAVGRLGVLLCPFAQTVWDAAYLPCLIQIGCPAVTMDGKLIDSERASAWFESDPSGHAVPPFAIAHHADLLDDAHRMLLHSAG